MIARVVDAPLSVAEHEDAVADKAAGAVVSFAGVVRDHDGGRSVTELEYVGHPTAEQVITELAEEFAARPDVHAVAVSHRIGLLGIDVALACAVSASHRGQAFAACAELVDGCRSGCRSGSGRSSPTARRNGSPAPRRRLPLGVACPEGETGGGSMPAASRVLSSRATVLHER